MPTHFQGRKETIRALNAFVNLIRASDSVAARMGAQIEQSGLTMGQFGVMEALLHLGPMCQHTLAEKLLRSGGNVTLVIDNLEKHGWVRRERQKDDRRVVKTRITLEGLDLLKALDQPVHELHKRQFQHVPSARLKLLIELLDQVLEKDPSAQAKSCS